MKNLLSQLFGLGEESIFKGNAKIIDKSIKPEWNINITPFSIEQTISGYEHRKDNLEYLVKEYNKTENQLKNLK